MTIPWTSAVQHAVLKKNAQNKNHSPFQWHQCTEFSDIHINALVTVQHARRTSTAIADLIWNTVAMRLSLHLLSNRPILSNTDLASLAMIGCFIVCTVSERIACAECIAMLQEPNSSAPNDGLATRQDRNNLYCPTQELVQVRLAGLTKTCRLRALAVTAGQEASSRVRHA